MQDHPTQSPEIDDLELNAKTRVFSGGGEMGALMHRKDWSRTPLGPVYTWPQSLRTTVQICLQSRFEIILWWGPEFTVLYNDAYRNTLRAKHPWALGQPGRVVWTEIWPTIGPMLEGVIQTGEATYSHDLLLFLERYGYPEETYHTFSYSPVLDEAGEVAGVFTAVNQTTERVIGERRLRTLRDVAARGLDAKSETEAWQIMASIIGENPLDVPFALFYCVNADSQRAELMASAGTEAGHGFCPDGLELEKEPVGPCAKWIAEVAESSKGLEIHGVEALRAGLPGGYWGEEPQELLVLPLAQTGRPQPLGVLLAGVSPRKRLDESYRDFFNILAGQIAKSVADAQAFEQERKRAEKLAELDRAKTVFFSNVSHEFRTPLTLLLGPLEEILSRDSDQLPQRAREQLETVKRNALRLLKLVNALLDFSRFEGGRALAFFEPTDLARLTQEVASVFRSAIEKAGMYLRFDCPPLSEPVYVNREMWEKIVLNLVSNAFKFTFEGGIHLTMTETSKDVSLSVADTGIGISEDEIPRLFERFHRVEGAHGRSFEGSGIGLALVQELVKLHGGKVEVTSAPGEGSQFTVSVPKGLQHLPQGRALTDRRQESTSLRAESYAEEALSWLANNETIRHEIVPDTGEGAVRRIEPGSVLLVDDNSDMRNYVRDLLAPFHRVITAANGAEALELIAEQKPELVLTDVMMPEMDGFELLRTIRSNPETSATKVILLSARAGEEAQTEGLERGADDYLIKPFTARELIARVNAHIAMVRLRLAAAEAERKLRREVEWQREMLNAALVASSTGTFSWDPQKRVYPHFDDNLKRLFGLPMDAEVVREELLKSRIHPEDLPHFLEAEARSEKTGVFEEEYRVVLPDGSIRWLYDRAKWRHESGMPNHFVGACTDITEKKLTQQALIQSEKLASVGRLAATVAHEINNPLEAATNLVYLARIRSDVPEPATNYLASAEEELSRVAEIARQTLGFYREELKPVPMRLGSTLTQLKRILSQKARNKDVALELEIKDDPELVGVPGELRQLFANLIGNALDAMEKSGKLWIRLRQANGSDGKAFAQVTVADSGVGIPLAIRKNIFDAFFTTKKDVGTGLGLWVSRNIVEKHGGTVRVWSSTRDGRSGTAFRVRLPVE